MGTALASTDQITNVGTKFAPTNVREVSCCHFAALRVQPQALDIKNTLGRTDIALGIHAQVNTDPSCLCC